MSHSNADTGVSTEIGRAGLQAAIETLRERIAQPRIAALLQETPEGRRTAEEFSQSLGVIESQLTTSPKYQLALLGTTRAGKSTLVNALLGVDLLPTSYTRPCTSGVIICAHSESHALTIEYETLDALEKARRHALTEAERLDQENSQAEAKRALDRFRVLMEVPDGLTFSALSSRIRDHEWQESVKERAGRTEALPFHDLLDVKDQLKDLLSSEGRLWPMVLQCRIEYNFPVLADGLEIVDLPGTNDPDLARTQLTRKFIRTVRALAIVTSSSNIGTDIQHAVAGADVLDRLMEGTERTQLNLMVIRTHLSSVQLPATDDDSDPAEKYEREQTTDYRRMLEKLVSESVSIPLGVEEQTRMDRVKTSIMNTPVFFVDSFASCALEGVIKPERRSMNLVQAWSEGDLTRTGIPGLRTSLVEVARQYAASQYYPDIRSRLEKAKGQVTKFFRDRGIQAQSNVAVCRAFATDVASRLKTDLLPWIAIQTQERKAALDREAEKGRKHLDEYLAVARLNAGVRFEDKKRIWIGYYWNTMRCVGRSEGRFWSSSRGLIDINDDIKEVLVDSMRVAWPVFRDYVIRKHTIAAAQQFEEILRRKLQSLFAVAPSDQEQFVELQQRAIDAIDQAIEEQKQELISRIDGKVEEFQSLQQPVYDVVRQQMADAYAVIAAECGSGCSSRMRNTLLGTFEQKREVIERFVAKKVGDIVSSLMQESAEAFNDLSANIFDSVKLLGDVLEAPSQFKSEVEAKQKMAECEEARIEWEVSHA